VLANWYKNNNNNSISKWFYIYRFTHIDALLSIGGLISNGQRKCDVGTKIEQLEYLASRMK
jgi:hypothetical protein